MKEDDDEEEVTEDANDADNGIDTAVDYFVYELVLTTSNMRDEIHGDIGDIFLRTSHIYLPYLVPTETLFAITLVHIFINIILLQFIHGG